MLPDVRTEDARCSEGFVAVDTLVWSLATVNLQTITICQVSSGLFTFLLEDHLAIVFGQPLCPVVGRKPQQVASKLPCLALSSCPSSICPFRSFFYTSHGLHCHNDWGSRSVP